MNKVIDKGFRSCLFVSTIVKHPVHGCKIQDWKVGSLCLLPILLLQKKPFAKFAIMQS